MALLWSFLAGLGYWGIQKRQRAYLAVIIDCLVFSHWLLDFVTHKPDLPLWIGGPVVGLGLWENRPSAFWIDVSRRFPS